jgi:hypothetical protein
MIKYQLQCGAGCSFEGWFRSSVEFERQEAAHELECPVCGDARVSRAIMAPYVRTASAKPAAIAAPADEVKEAFETAARRARDYIDKNFDYVGQRFPEEARRIHYGEAKGRPIWGEATREEAKSLVDEGVSAEPLHPALAPKRDAH